MIEYAIYLRKSRADLELEQIGSGETLARHKQILLDLAVKNMIHPNQIKIFQEVVSGESIESRPEMQKLLSEVFQKKFKAVLVMEVERLARGNTRDQGEVSDAFTYSNTKIITPSKIYDPSNEFDQEYFEFGLFMSRREYKTIRRRMQAGVQQSVNEGNYLGTVAPFGYAIQRINKKSRTLVINEDEAAIVHMIFNWFTEESKTTGWISRELTKLHIPTRNGLKEWNRLTIKDILQNPHYIGMVRWKHEQKIKEFDPNTGTFKKKIIKSKDCLIVPGKQQPIITKEQFEKAQSLFKQQVPIKLNTDLANVFSGILVCKDCKKTLKYREYVTKKCNARFVHQSTQLCFKKSIDAQLLIESVTDALKATLDDFTIQLENKSSNDEKEKTDAILQALKAELSKQEKRRQKLFDFLEDGSYTKEEFIERKKICTQNIENLQEQILSIENAIPEENNLQVKIASLHQTIDMIKDDSIPTKAKNEFLKTVIDRIEYDCEDLGRKHGTKPILDIFLK